MGEGPIQFLLVEHDPDARELAIHALVRAHLTSDVRAFPDAESGWEAIQRPAPGGQVPSRVLFLDADLPRDGTRTLLERLRQDPRLAATPVVVIAGSWESGERVARIAKGRVAVIVRALDPDAFRQSVTSMATYQGQRLAGSAAPLQVLLVEDDANHALLVRRALERAVGPCVVEHVADRPALLARLARPAPDLVVSDYSLPTLRGPETLALVRRPWPEVPFVVVSGEMLPELATEMLRSGATDYVMKDRLERLGPVVQRALCEAEDRKRAAATEAALRQTEERLRQAHKLEAIGRLASGIAHDFNNILVTMTGCSELMLLRMPENDPSRRDAQSILQASKRATELTRQLLAFGRKQPLAPRLLDVHAVLADMEGMVRRLIGEDIRLTITRGARTPTVTADPGQLTQVVLNLIVNARDAMPRGGSLTVRTADAERDGKPHLLLAVEDTGHGMDEATRARVFEPFFTTKEPGKGTGLGLAVVWGIVEQSRGHLEVRSEPGRGTTFEVHLPVSGGAAGAPPEAPPRREPTGTETVLVVEDDQAVRELTVRLLHLGGFRAFGAAGGEEALRRIDAEGGRIDLVLSDVVMPEMSGPELGARLAARSPTIPLLYVTGWSDEASVRYGIPPGAPFLHKPFGAKDLVAKVREVLDAAAAGPRAPRPSAQFPD